MTTTVIVTLFSLAILFFIAIGGMVSSKATTESTFFSMNQTNWLRSIAILMIMFSHFYQLLGLTYGDGLLSSCLNFGYLGVAIFFLLSGYSLMISKMNKPDYLKGFIKKRLVRLYIPFLLVYLCDVIVMLAMGKQITLKDILFIPLMSLPKTLNWYLKVQLGLYFVFYIFAKLIKNNIVLVVSTFALCFVYMAIGYFTGIAAFWYEGVLTFPLGMFIANNKDTIFSFFNKRYWFKLFLSVLILTVCFAPYYFKGGALFEILFIFGMLQFVVCFCVRFAGSPRSQVFTYLGVISLELYLVHTVINTHFISRIGLEDQSLFVGVTVFIAFIICSIIVSALVKYASDKIVKLTRKQ